MLGTAYADYLDRLPLQLAPADADGVSCWREREQLTKTCFARLVASIAGVGHLDDLSARCDIDFDNLAPVLAALSACGLVVISSRGSLEWSSALLPNPLKVQPDLYTSPSSTWNQFPCDPESRTARVQLLVQDTAFQESVRVGMIGDDDLLSPALAVHGRFRPVVLEGDTALLACLRDLASQRSLGIESHEVDLRNLNADLSAIAPLDTFITDPPYSYDGILTFLYQGLRLLRRTQDNRFYLIMNTMMLGRDLHRIEHALVVCGATLLEVRPAAYRYRFPKGYAEEERMRTFLDRIAPGARTAFSSSSSLFTWTAPALDLDRLRSFFDPTKIYRKCEVRP